MSRTNRERAGKWYRRPKTYNLRKQLSAIQNNEDLQDLNLGKKNRIEGLNPPSAWDDIKISACGESKYQKKQN